MSAVVVDTHALLWYLNSLPDLSPIALQTLERAEKLGAAIFIPSIVLIELRYLVEKGRDITESNFQTVITELKSPASALTLAPLDQLIAETLAQIPRAVVPDMPDRIIAATALSLGLPLVTRDTEISKLTNVTLVW
ncbi:MAG: type II toxin-antitoxin system VapC family toxin [Pyrinomonadaceae bacterium]